MGRRRSNYICPNCKTPGYLRSKYTWNGDYDDAPRHEYCYVVHYDHTRRKQKECYIKNNVRESLAKCYQNLSDEEFMSKMISILIDLQNRINKLKKKFIQLSSSSVSNSKLDKIMLELTKLSIEKEHKIILLGKLSRHVTTSQSGDLKKLRSSYKESHKKLMPIIKDTYPSLKELVKAVSNSYRYKTREYIRKLFTRVQKETYYLLKNGYYFHAASNLLGSCLYLKYGIPDWDRKKRELSIKLSEAA